MDEKTTVDTLEQIKTCYLIKELETRRGVFLKRIEPHKEEIISLYGPAVAIIVYD